MLTTVSLENPKSLVLGCYMELEAILYLKNEDGRPEGRPMFEDE